MDWNHSTSEPDSLFDRGGVDPFAAAKHQAQIEELDDGSGQECEIAVFESRYNKHGELLPLQVATVRKPYSNKVALPSALVLTKHFDQKGQFVGSHLEIKSPYVIKALRDVIKSYPGVEFGARRVAFEGPPKCIFHYRKELQEYSCNVHDATAAQHLLYTLTYMFSILESELASYYFSVEMDDEAPSLEYVNLWMVFRPGDLIYSNVGGHDRLYQLTSFEGGCLEVESVDFDGVVFGYKPETLYISEYKNLRKIRDLYAFPLKYHQNVEEVKTFLLARGKKFVSLAGIYYRQYGGITRSIPRDRQFEDVDEDEDEAEGKQARNVESMHIQSRIVIDHRSYATKCESRDKGFTSLSPISYSGLGLGLSNEQLMLCCHKVPAFALKDKTWGMYAIDRIHEIDFDNTTFASLLLPPGQKDIIQSLVEVHLDKRSILNDFIKGKGRGLIFMLYGVPGVGKTLTAESIAEHTRRPLYVVNCGDLGTCPAAIEKNFLAKSQQAVAWNAVMLIDEADMFLEKRRARELQRNALVSVFLRTLEYYEGILFLTTNRINACDAAIRSRIDLVIKYEALPASTRRDIFKAFIRRSCLTYESDILDDGFLEQLAAAEMNGREIKNVVRMAQALALTAKIRMGKHHLEIAADVMKRSNSDLTKEDDRLHNSQSEGEGQDEFLSFAQGPKRRRLH